MTDGDRLPLLRVREYPLNILYSEWVTSVTSVTRRSPSAWPRKPGHRCDHCGSQFRDMRPWDWPPDRPTRQIWLHPGCEEPWSDYGGLPESVR
jgi:hypothetical protein